MKCSVCGVSCFDKPLVRHNPKGETPAIWRCEDHSAEGLPEVAKIISEKQKKEVELICPKCGSNIIYEDRYDQQRGERHCDDCGHTGKKQLFEKWSGGAI